MLLRTGLPFTDRFIIMIRNLGWSDFMGFGNGVADYFSLNL
jgi:hypothetical protein